jgi:hypothetical protein
VEGGGLGVDFDVYNVLEKFPIEEVHKKTFRGGAVVSLPSLPFFFFFCDITKLAIIHKKIQPNLAIDQR